VKRIPHQDKIEALRTIMVEHRATVPAGGIQDRLLRAVIEILDEEMYKGTPDDGCGRLAAATVVGNFLVPEQVKLTSELRSARPKPARKGPTGPDGEGIGAGPGLPPNSLRKILGNQLETAIV